MARFPRLVIPGVPHHVTQRGNGRAQTFFDDQDYALYRALLADAAKKAGSEVWAYCLMPNHIHAIIVPRDEDGLRATFADAHRRYTNYVNVRNGKTGHLWQGRFGSVAMDDAHLAHAIRYVSLNPVRAGLAKKAKDWQWSSVGAHLAGQDDALVQVAPVLERTGDFARFLAEPFDADADFASLRKSERSGRPLGASDWIVRLEVEAGRPLAPQKRGPKKK